LGGVAGGHFTEELAGVEDDDAVANGGDGAYGQRETYCRE
jgi:hypothetical protein